ncbi:hypothetical protein Acsp06_04190 [Actinomycetospora sp. NBRC 106375]|uniref:hypothetical protein n=1 Tax=Actinomycetospora sp. NBRC 106375 TaxID=3032207 RepID=UPI0024A0A018|nr:hypothetical protein [Actinomycetospora sp. NBRC 106375]GLZ44234.1 hypothetical protein Acsp06_04190 [Actinomycetospora sp. NBRC 106375]
MGTDGFVDVLQTAHVTVRARPAVIEISGRAGVVSTGRRRSGCWWRRSPVPSGWRRLRGRSRRWCSRRSSCCSASWAAGCSGSDRYGSSDVALTAGGRSTVVVGRVPADEAEEIARCLRRLVRERDLTR